MEQYSLRLKEIL
ncbi:hypothetical protein Ccrd_017198 [Cynara cardunculus var. scolymus]|uniref:Uncharacterized protein n=1 Tax=Cynara cardunculus var. scolymus TaxID=59895 RepID=A0A118K2J8_CYNCS|nr:hypothetical protein Ccrd_017198 [Cynara cardunculus var. scolymus]